MVRSALAKGSTYTGTVRYIMCVISSWSSYDSISNRAEFEGKWHVERRTKIYHDTYSSYSVGYDTSTALGGCYHTCSFKAPEPRFMGRTSPGEGRSVKLLGDFHERAWKSS